MASALRELKDILTSFSNLWSQSLLMSGRSETAAPTRPISSVIEAPCFKHFSISEKGLNLGGL